MSNQLTLQITDSLKDLGYNPIRELTDGDSPLNSRVWLAESADGVEVAVKVSSSMFLSSFKNGDGEDLEGLLGRERDVYTKMGEHSNIPNFVDFHQVNIGGFLPTDVLVTEYIDAKNLGERVSGGVGLSEDKAKIVLNDVLSALGYVHEGLDTPVLHRDLKPSNMLFGKNGEDKEKAYLFDFDFAKIGDRTVSRAVQNSYYPIDFFGSKQTPSQDLVALANVVICLGYGKSIEEVRDMQGKEGLDSVDVDGLRYSNKLKIFLSKLSMANPASRYQSAKIALGDLENLDGLSEQVLENKVRAIERSEEMNNLIGLLSERDELFDVNVPIDFRNRVDDAYLLEYLTELYTRKEFVFEDIDVIKKHLEIGDRVIKKGDYDNGVVLKEGMKGKMKSWRRAKSSTQIMRVYFPEIKEIVKLEANLLSYRVSPGISLKIQGKKVKEVYYTGDEWYCKKPTLKVPDGTEGLVSYIDDYDRKETPQIIWCRGLGVLNDVNHPFNYNEFKLVRDNTVNFADVYRRCYFKRLK